MSDNNEIDVVITWVDGSDEAWKQQKTEVLKSQGKKVDAVDARYRDWDNLQFLFRGIEKFMPWVNNVFLVTWGHLPVWINTENPRLQIIRHEDFIPAEYLPTFNSNTIELNFHRISGLSNYFINFNDDMFVIKPTKKEDFFVGGLPCDIAAISPQPIQRDVITHIELNNLEIINDHFSMSDIKKNINKWINFKYGQYAIRTAIFMQFKTIIGVYEPHVPFSHLKTTMTKVWEEEYDALDQTCRNRFRSSNDCNEWLFRSWQLLSGSFQPRRFDYGRFLVASNVDEIERVIRGNNRTKIVCINDNSSLDNFESLQMQVNNLLNSLLPEKSTFEK